MRTGVPLLTGALLLVLTMRTAAAGDVAPPAASPIAVTAEMFRLDPKLLRRALMPAAPGGVLPVYFPPARQPELALALRKARSERLFVTTADGALGQALTLREARQEKYVHDFDVSIDPRGRIEADPVRSVVQWGLEATLLARRVQDDGRIRLSLDMKFAALLAMDTETFRHLRRTASRPTLGVARVKADLVTAPNATLVYVATFPAESKAVVLTLKLEARGVTPGETPRASPVPKTVSTEVYACAPALLATHRPVGGGDKGSNLERAAVQIRRRGRPVFSITGPAGAATSWRATVTRQTVFTRDFEEEVCAGRRVADPVVGVYHDRLQVQLGRQGLEELSVEVVKRPIATRRIAMARHRVPKPEVQALSDGEVAHRSEARTILDLGPLVGGEKAVALVAGL